MNKSLLTIISAVTSVGLLAWYLAQPKTYEDCVLRNMPAPSNDLLATHWITLEVQSLCRDKFPPHTKREEALPETLPPLPDFIPDKPPKNEKK